ncbi:MAG: extracellular solute-binding protein [Patescibacteria group bacterium]
MPDIVLPKPSAPSSTAIGGTPLAQDNKDFSNSTTNLTPPASTLKTQESTALNPNIARSQTLVGSPVNPGLPPINPSLLPPVNPSLNQNNVPRPPVGIGALSSTVSNKLPNNPPPATPKENPPPSPKVAKPKSSPMKFLPFILGGGLLLAIIIFVASKLMGGSAPSSGLAPGGQGTNGDTTSQAQPAGRVEVPTDQATLEYWGLWETEDGMSSILADFERENPGIKVTYTKQSNRDYRERLQTALASGNGPDLFRFHASWSPMLQTELAPMPSSVFSATQFKETFYPVASAQLTMNGQIYGVPLMYDGLVLYYNREIFETAGVEPPATWAELRTLAKKLTVKSSDGIERGGLAIGNASNVDHFSDILAVLMLQNGADLSNPNSPETRDALLFYTNFIKSDGVWSEQLPTSTVAFARGEVAMMFAPSWRAFEIQSINPELDFATTTLPQLSKTRIAWANYWVEGVSSVSKHQSQAWKLLKYLSSDNSLQKMYSVQSQTRTFGEPYSAVSLADTLIDQPVLISVLADAPYAKGWYLSSSTGDNGINDQLINYYKDAVNAILAGKSSSDVLTTLEQGTSQVLRQYGINSGASAGMGSGTGSI